MIGSQSHAKAQLDKEKQIALSRLEAIKKEIALIDTHLNGIEQKIA
jgi:hypothetical protein